jgi:hypothetical protein
MCNAHQWFFAFLAIVSVKPDLPYRRRQQVSAAKKTLWERVWASRTVWGVFGGAIAWVLSNGVESLTNLRKLPSEVQNTYQMFQSWYYDDVLWTGTWSSREEGYIDDYKQAELPLQLSVGTERGRVFGEIFNRSVCTLNPMLSPVLVEGEIIRGKLVAYAFAYVGGEKNFLYSFSASRSEKEPVITLSPLQDPHGLMPPSARLVHRFEAESQNNKPIKLGQKVVHHDLECPESPIEYLQRLRKEGVLKGVDELGIARKRKKAAK